MKPIKKNAATVKTMLDPAAMLYEYPINKPTKEANAPKNDERKIIDFKLFVKR